MIGGNKEYRAAIGFLNFRRAYKELVEATKDMPDLDVTEGYPFFLLDFEDIAPAVLNWATLHAGRLMDMLPDMVVNPACIMKGCEYLGKPIGTDGQCRGADDIKCGLYPMIMFQREQVEPALWAKGHKTAALNESEVKLLYESATRETISEVRRSNLRTDGI